MYYNSNKNNNAYYNAYKQEMADLEDYPDEFSFQKIIKIGFIILAVGLLSISTIYLANYFSTTKKEPVLTKSIQLRKSTIQNPKDIIENATDTQTLAELKIPNENRQIKKSEEVSPKDIALIVEIILAQMNHKEEIPLEKQLIDAEKNRIHTKTLKESNHYNKVILTSNNKNLLEMALISNEKTSSSYERAIKKEIDVRSNEMRIIIVQRGDTLSKIAKKAYGDIDAYPKIFIANPEILKNPNEIFAGQRLRIPV